MTARRSSGRTIASCPERCLFPACRDPEHCSMGGRCEDAVPAHDQRSWSDRLRSRSTPRDEGRQTGTGPRPGRGGGNFIGTDIFPQLTPEALDEAVSRLPAEYHDACLPGAEKLREQLVVAGGKSSEEDNDRLITSLPLSTKLGDDERRGCMSMHRSA